MNTKLIEERLADPRAKLVAVTKKHTREEVDELYRLGVRTFGENRVQEFLEKYNPNYDWHLIGHLQTNKVKYVVGKVSLIESVDSLKLAKEIEKQAAKLGIVQDILVEVRISRQDENKTGLDPDQLDALLEEISKMPHLRLCGLMTIASNTNNQALIAHEFDTMKEMFDKEKAKYPTMTILSMGMSHDYQLAIEHGSSQVRIGTALFA
ncbi:YggS family pyridoxal phosphate-dependent enzyme [Allobaculum sp. JKK-2023]|uniref:YggS family pyridoxal phosphate-dependent enzyme n=1 Tax=Allobaculum sp. JKK-2023 TaxID=3108943 RepID=UPI002B05E0B2|nr:YggS family pyridoxal phosphate-dependent enzyme [Allobaculum sp. JKK-2023]